MDKINLIRGILKAKGQFTLPLSGKSMEPTYFEGNTVTIIPADSISVGDIVLFEAHETLVFHRVVECKGDYLVTKGDNHKYCDDMICRTQVLGKDREQYRVSVCPVSRRFIFGVHNGVQCDRLRDILSHSNIGMEYNPEVERDTINVCVLPVANNYICDILPRLENHNGIVRFHFNIKVSDHALKGYHSIDRFDYVVRPASRITSALLTIEEQVIMVLGNLYGTGVNFL